MSRLLLVEDELTVCTILQEILIFAGHVVIAPRDGKEAFELIEKKDFELVITDLYMPDISGWEIAERVKNRLPHIPVILLTGWADRYERDDLSLRGVDELLAKPVTMGMLTGTIQRLTSKLSQETLNAPAGVL